jgi:hypothetical protein
VYFFPTSRRIASNLSHTTTMTPASKPGGTYLPTKKRKNRSTNINEEPHLTPLSAILLTNLKPQWQSLKDCPRHFFVFIPTKQIISIHEEPKLTAKHLLERELPDLPVLQ